MTPWFRSIRPSVALSLIARTLLLFAAVSVGGARTVELSDGLTYLRIKEVDAQPMPPAKAALVLDLRGTRASPESVSRFAPLLEIPGPGAIRLVLLDPDTAKPLLDLFKVKRPGVLTLAAAHEAAAVDIAVATSSDEDRQSRDAIDADSPLTDLLEPKREKRRYDEAAMVRDHANGLPIPESPPESLDTTPSAPSGAGTSPAVEPKNRPRIDAVLQRAIHLHQALRALGKL
ncbi:MAG TPA: hypothetical protein PKX00_02105 [Opitutaceae bacterium]|jgi:hypothetical protein|nr:hypothetical protein [Opitutaceae bacterium]